MYLRYAYTVFLSLALYFFVVHLLRITLLNYHSLQLLTARNFEFHVAFSLSIAEKKITRFSAKDKGRKQYNKFNGIQQRTIVMVIERKC